MMGLAGSITPACFNSTLVRFKRGQRIVFDQGAASFNSTLVRFKPGIAWRRLEGIRQFQFHFGSIQTLLSLNHTGGRDKFQFHFGSIQTENEAVSRLGICRFQFHFGSIQTPRPQVDCNLHDAVSIPLWFDSNQAAAGLSAGHIPVSIPLWFDSNGTTTMAGNTRITRFNSTLVRFKLTRGIPGGVESRVFQFHFGSIQT